MPVAGYRARNGLRYLRSRAPATGTPAVAGLGLLRTPAICWAVVGQAAYWARDEQLLEVVRTCEGDTAT